MIKFLKLENFKDQPDHPACGTDYFMSIGKFHVRLNSKPRGIQMGWDCRFWRTGWFFSVSSHGVRWVWNQDHDYV
jgi:hypothetical protein